MRDQVYLYYFHNLLFQEKRMCSKWVYHCVIQRRSQTKWASQIPLYLPKAQLHHLDPNAFRMRVIQDGHAILSDRHTWQGLKVCLLSLERSFPSHLSMKVGIYPPSWAPCSVTSPSSQRNLSLSYIGHSEPAPNLLLGVQGLWCFDLLRFVVGGRGCDCYVFASVLSSWHSFHLVDR